MFKHTSEFISIKPGMYIDLENGHETKTETSFFGLKSRKVVVPMIERYLITHRTNEFAPTMDFTLVSEKTGEERIITVSPNRRHEFYVKESI